jgi:hypothetical protein
MLRKSALAGLRSAGDNDGGHDLQALCERSSYDSGKGRHVMADNHSRDGWKEEIEGGPTAGRSGQFWLQPIRPDQQGIAGTPDAWSVDRIPPATKILAGLVSSDSPAAGINEIHPWLRDLPSDDQFPLARRCLCRHT